MILDKMLNYQNNKKWSKTVPTKLKSGSILALFLICYYTSAFALVNPTFVQTTCPVSYDNAGPVICGYVEVPLFYRPKPSTQTIKLDLAILKSRFPSDKAPVLFLEGGPGGNGMLPHNKMIYKFAEDRDLILFAQRGTGFSDLNQECKDMDIFAGPMLEALKNCRNQLAAAGVNFAAYNTHNSADDIANVIKALGNLAPNYKTVNLYGVSYGTLLSLEVIKYHPEFIRSVILDSTLAPQAHFLEEGGINARDTLNRFFADCKNSYVCNTNYPNLETEFYQLATRLNNKPMSLSFPWQGKQYQQDLTLENLLDTISNDYNGLPYLPTVIHLLATNNNQNYETTDPGSAVAKVFTPEPLAKHQFSFGNYWSVACEGFMANENLEIVKLINKVANLPPVLQTFFNQYAEQEISGCKIWLSEHKPNYEIKQPVFSDVPTLILSGEYDGATNATPPKWGKLVAWTLAKKYFYSVPKVGHEALRAGNCPLRIANEFYDDPRFEPDGSCLATM